MATSTVFGIKFTIFISKTIPIRCYQKVTNKTNQD